MAVTEFITLKTDASEAVTGIEQVTAEMQKLDETTAKTEQSTKSLKAQIREMTNELLNMAEDDPRRQQLIQQLGELKDRAADAADAVKGNTGPAFESMSNTFGIMTGQLANLDFDGLGKSLTQVGAAVGRVNFKSLMSELKGFAQGIGSLGKALLSNPIFLIGSIIAGAAVVISQNFDKIISYFPDIEKALTGINKMDKEAAKNAQLRAEASKKSYENINLEENALRLQGKSEREILQYKLAKLKTSIEDAKVNLEATRKNSELQMEAARKHAEIISKIVEITSFPILVLLDGVDQLRRVMGETSNLAEDFKKGMTTYVFDVGQVEQSWTKSLGDMEVGIKQMESDYAGLQLQMRRIDQESAQRRKEQKEKEKQNEREAVDENLEFIKGKGLETLEVQKQISLETINIKKLETKSINELDAELARLQRERLLKQREFRIQQAAEAFAVLADLNDAFISRDEKAAKRQFAVSKALNMAAAIMNTFGAVNKALNDETMPSTAARIVQATIVGVSGFANVAKIAKTQFGSTGSQGGNSGVNAGGGNNMPTAPAVDFGFMQQTGQPNTVETYVLAGNVANALEARQKIIDQSYL